MMQICGCYFDFDTLKIPLSFLGISEYNLCDSVLMLTGQVPVRDLLP